MSDKRYRIAFVIDYIISDYSNILLDGIKSACKDFNIELLIFPIGELHSVQYAFDYQYVAVTGLLNFSNVDGIIFASGTQMHYLKKSELESYLKSYKLLPSVSISVAIPGIPSITVDCSNAYKELIDNLINVQKCRKFGIMGVRSHSNEVRTRTKILKSLLEERGFSQNDVYFWRTNFDYGVTMNELEAYYDANKKFDFDAIISLNDEQAFACIDFCKKHHFRVPEDVIVVGFDNIKKDELFFPTVTSIDQRVFNQGYESVSMVKDIIDGKSVKENKIIEATCVVRQSSTRFENKQPETNYLLYKKSSANNLENYNALSEWYEKKNQIFQITRFYNEMQYDMTQDQLRKRINNDVKSFGVTAFAIVLYENPIETTTPFDYFTMPKKAHLFSAFDYATDYDSSKTSDDFIFDPNKEILPPGLIQFNSEGIYIISLFHNTLQYGYIVFRRGTYDIAIYDLLSKIISTIMASVHSFTLVHNEHIKFQSKYNKLDIIANTDELTGLYNRRGFYDIGQTTLKFAQAMNQSGLIVYSDMDGLKKINDTFGHETGDHAIIAESIILKSNFRSNDVVARIGGDEFVMLCPGLTKENFARIKNQIDKDCKNWTAKEKTPYQLSISMGCVEYPAVGIGYQLTPLLSEADSMLYMEKRSKKAKLEN